MLALNGERTNLTKLQWIQVRIDNFKRFYRAWSKDGIKLIVLVSNTGEGSNGQGIFSSGVALALPGRQTQGFWWPTTQTQLSSTTEPNAVF